MDNPEKQTLVEEGTEFSGTLKSKCKVVVRGAVDGDLVAPSVDVTETGAVTGKVTADTVHSSGVLAGQVEAEDIRLAGEVRSNTVIKAKSLEVKLTAEEGKLEVTFGDCVLDVGDLPSKEQIDAPTDAAAESAEGESAEAAGPDEGNSNGRRRKRRRGRKGDSGSDETSTEASAEVTDASEADASPSAPAE